MMPTMPWMVWMVRLLTDVKSVLLWLVMADPPISMIHVEVVVVIEGEIVVVVIEITGVHHHVADAVEVGPDHPNEGKEVILDHHHDSTNALHLSHPRGIPIPLVEVAHQVHDEV